MHLPIKLYPFHFLWLDDLKLNSLLKNAFLFFTLLILIILISLIRKLFQNVLHGLMPFLLEFFVKRKVTSLIDQTILYHNLFFNKFIQIITQFNYLFIANFLKKNYQKKLVEDLKDHMNLLFYFLDY